MTNEKETPVFCEKGFGEYFISEDSGWISADTLFREFLTEDDSFFVATRCSVYGSPSTNLHTDIDVRVSDGDSTLYLTLQQSEALVEKINEFLTMAHKWIENTKKNYTNEPIQVEDRGRDSESAGQGTDPV